MDKEKLLSLCDPHNSIVHQFGCDPSCLQPAPICQKGCTPYQHKLNGSKHQFLEAGEFYWVVGSVRERYGVFKRNFQEVYLKQFLEGVQSCLDSFPSHLHQYLHNNPLIDIFSRNANTAGDMFQQVIEDTLEEVELADLNCREVYHLRAFDQQLQRDSPKDQQHRMVRMLSKIFENHLRSNGLLFEKAPLEKRARGQVMIEVDKLEALHESLKRKAAEMEYALRQEKVEEVLVILHCEEKEVERKGEAKELIANLFTSLQNYIDKTLPQRLTFAVNFPLLPNPFWDNLALLVAGKRGVKELKVCTMQARPKNEFEEELGRKCGSTVGVSCRYGLNWEEMTALIDKRRP